MDGAINSNTSGLGPSGFSGPDPDGIHARTRGAGNVTVIADDNITNQGPGQGIHTTVQNGLNSVSLGNASIPGNTPFIHNTLGDGIHALAWGNGDVQVTTLANTSIVTDQNGIWAQARRGNVTVNAQGDIGNATQSVTTGIDAEVTSHFSGTGNVDVTTGNGTILATDYGIYARNHGDGDVSVTTGAGNIVIAGTPVGTTRAGIWAQSSNFSGNVSVTNASDISVSTDNGNLSYGIGAMTNGDGTVQVNNSGNIDPATFGIYATSAGGPVFGNSSAGNVVGDTGIMAAQTAAYLASAPRLTAPVSVNVTGGNVTGLGGGPAVNLTSGNTTVNVNGGNAIFAGTGLEGTVTVNVGTDTSTGINITGAHDGILAASNGSVAVTVTGNLTGVQNTVSGQGDVGIYAWAMGNVVANLGDSEVSVTNTKVSGQNEGIVAVAPASVIVTTDSTSDVEAGGIGIIAASSGAEPSADVTVTSDGTIGADTPVGFAGILASQGNFSGTGDVKVGIGGDIDAGIGSIALNFGTGFAQTTVSDGVTITAAQIGIINSSFAATDPNSGVNPASQVILGDNDTITAGGNTSFGVAGVFATSIDDGSTVITTGNNTQIHVAGDFTGGLVGESGDGNITITTGTGNITVGEGAGSGPGFLASAGIAGLSDDGNVSITTAADISGVAQNHQFRGIDGRTGGSGLVSVTTSGNITAGNATFTNGQAIHTVTAAGNNTVHVLGNGTVLAATDDGIHAVSYAGGAISVTTDVGNDIEAGGDGIHTAASSGPITVNVNGTIGNTTAVGDSGVDAVIWGFGSDSDITVNGNGTITSEGEGIRARNRGFGGVNITTAVGGDVTSTDDEGIHAFTRAGDINIDASGNVTAVNDGVHAWSNGGNVFITTNGTVSSEFDRGIFGGVGFGSGAGQGVQIVTTNTVTALEDAGIVARNLSPGSGAGVGDSADYGIVIAAGGTITAGGAGIDAQILNINNNDNVWVNVGGNLTGSSGLASHTADINAEQQGVFARTFGGGNVTVVSQQGQDINSQFNDGIDAWSNGGNVLVELLDGAINSNTSHVGPSGGSFCAANSNLSGCFAPSAINVSGVSGLSVQGDPNGVWASTTGSGTVTVIAEDNITNYGPGDGILAETDAGDIAVTVNTSATVDNTNGDGIGAISNTGNISILIGSDDLTNDADTAAVISRGYGDGIFATTGGNGSISVWTSAGTSVEGAWDGIDIDATSTTGAVHVNTWGTLQGDDGSGINIDNGTGHFTTTSGNVTTDYGGFLLEVNGDVTSLTGSAISTTSAAGGTINIGFDVDPIISGPGDVAPVISVGQASGNTTTINIASNSTVTPFDNDSSLWAIGSTGTTGSVVVNNGGEIDGQMDFSSLTDVTGATVVNNSGDWFTQGNSTFGGGNMSANVVNNSGVIDTDFGSATFNNLGTLNNLATGVLELETGFASDDPLDGPTGTLTAPGTHYVGTAGSVIAEDAFLGGAGSTSDSLHVGTTSGASSIFIYNENTGGAGYIPAANGIVLVGTTGTNAANFTLDPASGGNGATYTTAYGAAALQKDLWLYTLVNQPNQTILVSVPGPQAYQFTDAITAAQTIWYMDSPWQDRQADLRDNVATTSGGAGGYEPGVWLKAVGDWASRDRTVSPIAGLKYDVGYNQTTYGIMGGIDADHHGLVHPGDTGLLGITGGYLSSDLDFKNSPAQGKFEGYEIGGYGTYISGPFYIDAQVKADILRLKASYGSLSQTRDAHTIGGQIEGGYRFAFLGGTVEPLATLAYASTTIGSFQVGGTTIRTDKADSFRGSLGLRFSTVISSGPNYLMKFAVEGRAWDEFEGDNHITLQSSGPDLRLNDDFSGVFGEVGGGFNIFSKDGHHSGFLNASYKFKDNYEEGKVAVGYRYQWGAPPPPPRRRPRPRRLPRRPLRLRLRRPLPPRRRNSWPRTSWSTSRSTSMS